MMERREGKPEKRRTRLSKTKRIALIAVAGLLGVVLIIAGTFLNKLAALNQDAIPIVTKPADQTEPTASVTTLPLIEGTPSDLDTDYEVEVPEPSEIPIYEVEPLKKNVINILLLSSDARANEKIGRSDSMILITYDQGQNTLKLTSFMRDSWVRIEGHGWNRINAAYSFGGIGLAINTVNDSFELDIQNYITIRFEQFVSIVDQLGGIELNLSEAETAYINNYSPEKITDTGAGLKLLNGEQMLVHCRNRHVGNGDFERTRRQREAVLAIMKKIRQQRDPVALTQLITFGLDHVQTNMKPNEIISLALEALGKDDLQILQARVPFDHNWHYANESGRSVVAIDLAENRRLLHQFLYE